MIIDWNIVRLAYVNSNKSLREVAEDFGIKSAGIMRRAAREGWDAERQQTSANVSKNAQSLIMADRTDELAKSNEANIKLARIVRGQVEQYLSEATGLVSAVELCRLVSAIEKAQRIERLALGVSTDNSETSMTVNDTNALVQAQNYENMKAKHGMPT